MKKIMVRTLVALLSFSIGVAICNYFYGFLLVNKSEVLVEKEELIFVTPDNCYPELKTESKPFFDSFDEDNGYSGWFIADDFKGMREVWTILLLMDLEDSDDRKLVWSARILTQLKDGSPNDKDKFHSIWIKTENNQLSFNTNKIRGIQYKFKGEFFKNGKSFAEEEKLLKGTLQKFIKGKKVTEFTSDFVYFEPCCFH